MIELLRPNGGLASTTVGWRPSARRLVDGLLLVSPSPTERHQRGFGHRLVLLSAAAPAGLRVLIGRYSLLQRGRSYAELARWVGGDPDDPTLPVAAVLAMTDDFEGYVLRDRDDRTKVPAKLRDEQSSEWSELAGLAEKGIRSIEREMLLLEPPDPTEFDRAYATVKALHGAAFDWSPPDVPGLERLGNTRMRQYVRAWINAWDLIRLDPDYAPDTEVVELASSYAEDEALESDRSG